MNTAFIPVLHKKALKDLIGIILKDETRIKIDRKDKNEILVIFEDNVWIINKEDLSITYFKYYPSISIWIPKENVIQFFNEPGYNIKKLEEFIK